MDKKYKQYKLKDIAERLGVTTSTVSRALKDYPDISKKTREKVQQVAKEWNYYPDSLAVSLRKKTTSTIGVIIPEIVHHFFSSVIRGIMEYAYGENYRVMLCYSDESGDKEALDAESLFRSRVDGLLISIADTSKNFEHLERFLEREVPVVFFDKVPETGFENCSRVVIDDYKSSCMVTEHLIEQGRRDIGYVAGPVDIYTASRRVAGYKDTLKKFGIPVREEYIFHADRVNFHTGYDLGMEIAKSGIHFDAMAVVADSMAIGLMQALKKNGRKVPQDIAIAGFSNWLMSRAVEPPLTTVEQSGFEIGKKATELLLNQIKTKHSEDAFVPETHIIPTELIVRESTVKP